jgi:anti-sigma factor RsiW
VLEQMDNPSALLMYLAGELPPEERAIVEQRLAADPSLRSELEEIRSAQAEFEVAMAALDRAEPVASEASAVARIGRAMRQHQVRVVAVPDAPSRSVSFWNRVPRWSYPLTAAAAAALVYVGWWALKPVEVTALVAMGTTAPVVKIEGALKTDADDALVVEGLENNLRNSNRTQGSTLRELRQMEVQLAELSRGSVDPLEGLLADHPNISENE